MVPGVPDVERVGGTVEVLALSEVCMCVWVCVCVRGEREVKE